MTFIQLQFAFRQYRAILNLKNFRMLSSTPTGSTTYPPVAFCVGVANKLSACTGSFS